MVIVFLYKTICGAPGDITTVVGDGSNGFGGDNGAATSARMSFPQRVTLDVSGNVFLAHFNGNRIFEYPIL